SVPAILTTPDVGLSMQPIMFKIVDLPDPDGPVMEMKSPFSTLNDTPRTACTCVFPSGYTLFTSISSTMTCLALIVLISLAPNCRTSVQTAPAHGPAGRTGAAPPT